MSEILLKIENVTKKYGTVEVLKGISLELREGEQYSIRGSSGSGKSTLLYMLGGLDTPSTGRIWLRDKDLSTFNDAQQAHFRNRFVGFVFQFHFLLPSMSCLDNIYLSSKIGNCFNKEVKEHVSTLTELLGVNHCLKKFPYELSGGEQQRINIVRALSLRPKLLLCDEPTGNLDSTNSLKVIELLKTVSANLGSTLIVVTHDNLISSHLQHQVLIKDGRVQ